jgi:hypothetical protein
VSAVSPNVAVTTDPSVQQMPSIAADPADPRHLVVAYMDYALVTTGYAGIGVAVSRDGGGGWQHASIPLPAGFDQGAANPIAHFDGQGHVFVSFMAATFLGPKAPLTNANFEDRGAPGEQSNNGIFVARSDDGGLSWQPPVAVVSHLYDGQHPVLDEVIPDLAIDTFRTLPDGQPNAHYGELYVAWTRIYPAGQFPGQPDASGGTDIMIAVSRDGGQTYQIQLETVPGVSTPVTVIQDPLNGGEGAPEGQGVVDQAHLSVGPEGDLYLAYYAFGDFSVAHSTDGGASFAVPDHKTNLRLAFGNGQSTNVNEAGLTTNKFRTFPSREIVADPARPGYVYAASAVPVFDRQGNQIDDADIIFARSTDYGLTWQTTFQLGLNPATVVNDDNSGSSASGVNPDEVVSVQAMPRLSVDAQGNISLIWYDARHDPANHRLDVFGTTSTDGGQTFSPNFRVTDQSFDANQGKFTDATGQDDYYLGDNIGLALADNTAYAAWTDIRAGNQDVYFSSYPITPPPAPPNDRYEPNNTASEATDLGQVVQRLVPKLALPAGDEDWFRVRAAATGNLTVSATSTGNVPLPPSALQLQVWDDTGTNLLATGSDIQNAAGNTLGQSLSYPSNVGQSFLVRVVRGLAAGNDAILYALNLQSLTEDLETRVLADVSGTLPAGAEALYRLTAAAAGSLQVQFTNGAHVRGNLNVQVLDPNTFAVLSSPVPAAIPASEPDDSIGQANPTGLDGPGSVQLAGYVGDGAFGTTSGDYDFYSLKASAGQRIAATLVDSQGSRLDGVIALYDSAGNLLLLVDNSAPGGPEFLSFVTTKTDTYYLAVYGSTSTDAPPTDPFTPGTGGGLPSHPGGYSLTIAVQVIGPGAVEEATVPVRQGQTVLLSVAGEGTSAGDYDLRVTNLDQFATPDNASLRFPAGAGPSQVAVGDFNGDGKPDLVVSNAQSNTVSVLLNNGDGTFQSPRQFTIGSFKFPSAPAVGNELGDFRRQLVLADFNHDGKLDIAVTNYDSGDISVLLGRGDGTFEPQRRFDATSAPFGLAVGDLNGDGVPDLVAIDSHAAEDSTVAVLLGRGDGTFEPQQTFAAHTDGAFPFSTVTLADLNHDGKTDLIVSGGVRDKATIFLGNGDGTFQPGVNYQAGGVAAGVAVADVNGDGIPDVIATAADPSGVTVLLGNGDGTFTPLVNTNTDSLLFPAGQSPVAVAVADFGSQVTQPDGSVTLGPPDGHPDLIVAASGAVYPSVPPGPRGIFLIPTLWDSQGQFIGLGVPQLLAPAEQPLDVTVRDVNGDGAPDIVAVDQAGALVIFGKRPRIPPNDTPGTARSLGTVVHLIEPTLTIVPRHEDAYYTLTAPTEDARGAGDEVLDFSALFQATAGAGLQMEVRDAPRDAAGHLLGPGGLLGSGERFRVRVPQGAALYLHVFGVAGGTGAYTLDIDALPQLVSVQAEALLPGATAAPGGPVASLVLTFQGDRLDPDTAQDPSNYTVTYLGPDGAATVLLPTSVAVRATAGAQPVTYDPGANVDVATGITYPTAVRQTVTLLFGQPLPAGDYRLVLSPAIQAAAFSPGEGGLLAPAPGLSGHTVVSRYGSGIVEGDRRAVVGLVPVGGALGSLAAFKEGTPFLTQLHDDLGALLDAGLTQLGDAAGISAGIDNQIVGRFLPALGPAGGRPFGVLVVWLDPMQAALAADDRRGQVSYDPHNGTYKNSFGSAYVSVAGIVEVFVVPLAPVGVSGYVLDVAPSPTARGGVAYFGPDGEPQVRSLTADLRAGVGLFDLTYGTADAPPPKVPAAAPAAQAAAAPTAGPGPSIAVLLGTNADRAVQLPVTSLVPIAAAAEAGGVATTVAPAGGTAAGRVPPVTWPPRPPDPPDPPPPPPPWRRLIEAMIGLADRLFPGLVPAAWRWLRARLPAKGDRAAVDPPAPVPGAVGEQPAVEAAPVGGVVAGAAAAEEGSGGGWSWAALLGLAGGYLLNGGPAPARDRRKRPRLPEAG